MKENKQNNKLVYIHKKPNGEVFYVGMGNPGRESSLARSEFWYEIAKQGYEIEVLVTGLSIDEACIREIDLISFYGRRDLGTGPLVNLSSGGKTGFNSYGKEVRQLSAVKSGITRRKSIDQFDLDNNFIRSWNSLLEAAKDLGIESSNISKVLRGKRSHCNKSIWRYSQV